MADPLGGAVGAVMGEMVKYAIQTIKKGQDFAPTLETNIQTLNALAPLVEEMKSFNDLLDRPREEINKLETHIREGKELVRKSKKLTLWRFFSFPSYQSKLQKKDEALQRHLAVNVQVENRKDLMDVLIKVNGILEILMRKDNLGQFDNGNQIRGLCGVPEEPQCKGMVEPLNKLKIELIKDGVSVLVLTGLGGSGKSTLAKKLCWDSQIKGKFGGNIFFVTVSKTPNLKNIVQTLFEHCGLRVPEFHSDEDAINRLGVLLRQVGKNPILLVLDDVWPNSEGLVEKFKFKMSDYKILVTSRVAFRRFGTPFPLDPLDHDHAVSLFHHFAQSNHSSSYMPDKNLVHEIVKGCKGSPLALQRIPVTALIDMWAALYNLDEDGTKAMAIVHDLNTRNLISVISTRKVATETDMYYNNHYVVMHDLLRELAIHQSKGEPFEQRKRLIIDLNGDDRPDWWIGPNQQGIISRMYSFIAGMLIKQKQLKVAARILSISTDESFSSDWCDMQPDEAEVLILNLRSNKYSLPDFTEKMSKLKVLIVTNHGFHRSELTKFELLGFLSDLKRIRLEKVSVPCLCILKNLQKLSLHMCNTRSSFESCSIQISDALPNLVELSIGYCNDLIKLPDGFCNITTLKKLSITNCHKLSAIPQDIGKLENLEVLRLCSCSDLEEMPESISGLNKLCCFDISDCVSLPNLPNDIGDLQKLEKLYMKGCSNLSELPYSVINFGNLKHKISVICDEEGASLWEHFPDIPNLKIEMPKVEINLNWLHGTRS
ncbi:hypothetical protein P8452_41196 [Trifolium repens]|nr:hypothetical protein P8452_41196 [Trifolium repens]